MRRERMTNPKCLGTSLPDTFGARSADLTGLKMRRITRGASFDHLVGKREQLVWNLKAKGLGGLEIDDKVVLGRGLHRQVGRLLAFEDAIDVPGGAPGLVDLIRPVGGEGTVQTARAERIVVRQAGPRG